MYETMGLNGHQLIYYVCLLCALILVGWFVWYQVSRARRRRDLMVVGFLTLGALVGLILGLSASPIVRAVMAAAFTTAALLLRLFEKRPLARSSQRVIWMAPFAGAAIFGIFVGIIVRSNDLLSAPEPTLRERLLYEGFTQEQTHAILARWEKQVTPADLAGTREMTRRSVLLSTTGKADDAPGPGRLDLPKDLAIVVADRSRQLSVTERLAILSLDVSFRTRISKLRIGLSADETLDALKDDLSRSRGP